jgi:hypothetical protein
VVLCGAALLELLAGCILTGCMRTRVGHIGGEAEHAIPPDVSRATAAGTSTRRRAVFPAAEADRFGRWELEPRFSLVANVGRDGARLRGRTGSLESR